MRSRFLAFWGGFSSQHPLFIVLGALLVTAAAVVLSSDMKMTTRWSDLLPLDDPKVAEFDNIIQEFTNTSNTIIVVRGDEEQIKRFADEIVPRIRAMSDDVERVDYQIEEDFFRRHGFLLSKERYLKNMPDIFQDLSLIPLLTHINDDFEEVYTGDEESLSSKEREDNAVRTLDGIQSWIETMTAYARGAESAPDDLAQTAVERFVLGDPYFISYDKRMLLIMVEPTFSIMDIERTVVHVDTMQQMINEMLPNYPGVHAGLTGMMPLCRDEMVYSTQDLGRTSILALALIIILFILSFRIISAPILAAINLIMGIIWTLGISSLFLSSLNIMTSMFGVILIGLGIDFSIHIISVYNEHRHQGMIILDAVTATLLKSGGGIITGGLTTSCAFFTLMISNSRGIKEMGLILGIGILCTMLATILVLPSILILRERVLSKFRKGKAVRTVSVDFRILGNLGSMFYRRSLVFVLLGVLITAFLFYQAINVKFDYNYLNMEPKGIESVTLQDSVIKAFNLSTDVVMVTAGTLERVREITESARDLGSIGLVESITDYIPSQEQHQTRKPYVEQILSNLQNNQSIKPFTENNVDELIAQLKRLNMNVYELSQMAFVGGQDRVDAKAQRIIGDIEDPNDRNLIMELTAFIDSSKSDVIAGLNRFQDAYEPKLRQLGLTMADTSSITLESLPEQISKKYFNRTGDQILITIYPKLSVWDISVLDRFTEQMERIDPHITGMPPMFRHLITYIGNDGKRATLLTLMVVFLLLWFDFRTIRMALLGMVPLVFGAVWMVGIMKLLGLQLTFVNVMAIPMIVGIGIDDGVHLLHRYRVEGPGKIQEVMNSTGKAILLTSLTTMAGFGSLMIAHYRGFVSLGALLVIGVGACYLATTLLLPALLGLTERKVKTSE